MDEERRGGVMSSRGETSQRKQWMGWEAQKQRGWGENPEPTTPTLGGGEPFWPLLSPFPLPTSSLPLFFPHPIPRPSAAAQMIISSSHFGAHGGC